VAEEGGPKEIRALRHLTIAKYGRDNEFQRREDRLKRQVALSQPFDDDGIREYILRLDPEGSAALEAAIGPLAAPAPAPRKGRICGRRASAGVTR
jgi:hypothetical protein